MPAGVSWPTYLKFFVAAGLSMFAGSHTVHTFYRLTTNLNALFNLFISWSLLKFRPLDDMEAWFQKFEAEERRQRMIMEAMQEQKSSQDSKPSGQDVKTEAEVAAAWDPAQRSKMASCSFPASTFILANSLNSLWSEKHRFIECAELCRLQSYVDKLTKIYFELNVFYVIAFNMFNSSLQFHEKLRNFWDKCFI